MSNVVLTSVVVWPAGKPPRPVSAVVAESEGGEQQQRERVVLITVRLIVIIFKLKRAMLKESTLLYGLEFLLVLGIQHVQERKRWICFFVGSIDSFVY